jgi:hypothetical protein
VELTPDNVKVLGGALVASLGVVATAIGFLIRTAYKLGQDAHRIAMGLESLTEIKVAVKEIPVIQTRLGVVEEAWSTTRSDIKHLLRRPSQPDFDGE